MSILFSKFFIFLRPYVLIISLRNCSRGIYTTFLEGYPLKLHYQWPALNESCLLMTFHIKTGLYVLAPCPFSISETTDCATPLQVYYLHLQTNYQMLYLGFKFAFIDASIYFFCYLYITKQITG
jgi:disulfide bond formation protein DsbB